MSAGRHFVVDDITITPLASLQASSVYMGGYTVTGAGDINLRVSAQNYGFVETGMGVRVARHFALNDQSGFVVQIHAKWLHELLNQRFQNTASFAAPGSTSFVTSGLQAAPDTLNVGAGFTLLSCACNVRTWSVEAQYDFFWRSGNYSAHQLALAGSYRF